MNKNQSNGDKPKSRVSSSNFAIRRPVQGYEAVLKDIDLEGEMLNKPSAFTGNIPTWIEMNSEFRQSFNDIQSEIDKQNEKNKKIFEPLAGRFFQSDTAFFKVLSVLSVDSSIVDIVAVHCKMNTHKPEIAVRSTYIYLEENLLELTKDEFIERVNKRMDILKQIINQ